MSEDTPEAAASQTAARRSRISQADIPSISLEKARRIPQAIADNYGSGATRPLDVASAIDMTPSSGNFRVLCGAAVGYGLTDGGPNAPSISLTKLGARVVTPQEVDDDRRALREAALKPTIAAQFYKKYDGSPLPPKNIGKNVLAGFGVPTDRTEKVFDLLVENARHVDFLKTIKDKEYVDVGGPLGADSGQGDQADGEDLDPDLDAELDDLTDDVIDANGTDVPAATPPTPATPAAKNAIFVGHGGNKKPADQLTRILTEYRIPFKQAVEEPNRARPIPVKVADTMRECGAAILVFTADQEYFDADGNSIWRPSENVSNELGAASVLYGERIVIFKENGVDLASNFSSIGYIEFEKDKLSDKGIELFRELVSMKILNVTVG